MQIRKQMVIDYKQCSILQWVSMIGFPLYFAIWAFNRSMFISITPKYYDFIVGYPTIHNVSKIQDIFSGVIFTFVFVLLFFIISVFINQLKKKKGEESTESFSISIICWLSPMLIVLSKYLFSNAFDFNLFVVFFIPLTLFFLFSLFFLVRGVLDVQQVNAVVVISLLLSLLPSAVSLIADRLFDYIIQFGKVEQASNYIFLSSAILIVLLLVRDKSLWQSSFIGRCLLFSQLLLLVFYLALFPSLIRDTNLGDFMYQTTFLLPTLVGLFMLLGVIDIWLRYKKYILLKSNNSIWKLFSPVAIFGLIIMIKFPGTVYPNISTDNYHFGEYLLGFWSYIEAGYTPYKDFIPAHGLILNYFPELVNLLFYDGKAGSFTQASILSQIILSFITFIVLYKYYRNILLSSIIILVFLVGFKNWLVLIPFTLLYVNHNLIKKPEKWLTIWLLSAPVVFLLVPAQGLGLIVGSGFIGLYCLYQLKSKEKIEWIPFTLAMTLWVGLLIFTSTSTMLFGAFDYVSSNSKINQLAYGINWSVSKSMSECPIFLFELFRNSWIWVFVLVSLYTIKRLLSFSFEKLPNIVTGLLFLGFILLMVPYAMGRIDPFVMSRPGITSIFFVVLVIPALFWNNNMNRQVLIIITLIMLSSGLSIFPDSDNNFKSNLVYQSATPELIDFHHSSLSNIGVAFVEPNQLERLRKLADVLTKEIEPGNTYWDLTNSIATYRYLNFLPPASISAPYNQPSTQDQIRSVDQIENKNIDHLLIDHYILHDGVALALRTPYIFRYIMNHFNFDQRNGILMGFRKDSVPFVHQIALEDLTDNNWQRGVNINEGVLLLKNNIYNYSKIKYAEAIETWGDTLSINDFHVDITEQWIYVFVDGLVDINVRVYNVVYESNEIERASISRLNILYFENTPHLSSSHLWGIPNAWAQSKESLKPMLTSPILLPDTCQYLVNDIVMEDDYYVIAGNSPYLHYDLKELDIQLNNASMLFIELIPDNTISNFDIDISIYGTNKANLSRDYSLSYSSRRVGALIPLDSQPVWYTLQNIDGLRISIGNVPIGTKFTLSEISLYDRH